MALVAKFATTCPLCFHTIAVGDSYRWHQNKTIHLRCRPHPGYYPRRPKRPIYTVRTDPALKEQKVPAFQFDPYSTPEKSVIKEASASEKLHTARSLRPVALEDKEPDF